MGILKRNKDHIDPVCGMTVPHKQGWFVMEHEGRRYYFCAAECLKTFEQNPRQYLDYRCVKRKTCWDRYLARLNKATKGQSMNCH
jgi:YHS domain-containing protein